VNIDWGLVFQIAVPIGMLFLGKYLDFRFFRPKLITHLLHTSAFALPAGVFHTHSIVVRNAGRETAKDVRIGHYVMPPHFNLFPPVPHTIQSSTNGISEIVIPHMVPGEQLSVSYSILPSAFL